MDPETEKAATGGLLWMGAQPPRVCLTTRRFRVGLGQGGRSWGYDGPMGEYGYESTPREPFEYRLCPFCGHRAFAVYWSDYRFRCQHCSVQGNITRDSEGHYPSPPVVVDVHPWRRGYG
jgi:hypothetical protein